MKSKQKYFLILHLPPPYGGGEIRAKYLLDNFKDNPEYYVYPIHRRNRSKKMQGRFHLTNILFGISLVLKVCYRIIRVKPAKLFTGIPKDFPSFIRTSWIVSFAKLFGIKIFGELAGMSFPFLKKSNYFVRKFTERILLKVDSFRFLSRSIMKTFDYLIIKNKVYFDNGIKLPFENDSNLVPLTQKKLKLLYVGSLEKSKGIYKLVNALKICVNNSVDLELNIIGEWVNEKQKEEILNFIKLNHLPDYIQFHGLKTGIEKWNIFKSCAVLVHPTYWDGQPISILEAMGLGLGVISTNVGAIPETVINGINGIIIDENTPENLFKAIELLYNDRELLLRISKNNIKTFKKRFTLEHYLSNFKNWIESDETVCAE
jgi:glycosyltransferase involved in cell wall biosynthesis